MQQATPNSSPLLKLDHVAMRYEAIGDAQGPAVLEDICLELSAGDSLAIVGPSGSGKSTLLNIMGTLDRPTGGSVWLDGRDLAHLTEPQTAEIRNQRIGFIFQEHHLLPQCTVLENVLVPTLVGPVAPAATDEARKLLARVDLSDRLHHRPGELSGGQRQRVAVVRALINQPGLLLADEPTGSLDRASAEELGHVLTELNRESGVTLVTVTHSRDLANSMARRLELRDGRLHPLQD